MDRSSEEGPEAQLGTVGRHKDAVERLAFEQESELERDAYIDEATRRATSEHKQRMATYKMDSDYADTLRIRATIRRESERERAGWYERRYYKSRLVEIYREVECSVRDDAPNFSGNGVEVHEQDDREIIPLYSEPGFEEEIFGDRAVIGVHLTGADLVAAGRHAVYPLQGYVAIVRRGGSRAEKLEHLHWLSDGDVLEGAMDTFSSGEGGSSRTLVRMRYEIRAAQASSADEAAEAGEEDEEEEDEEGEEELDFAEKDEERSVSPPAGPRRLARTKRSVLDDFQRGRVHIARPVLQRYRDARQQRSSDGKNTVSGYLSKPPPQGYVGISYGSADDEKEDENESEEEHGEYNAGDGGDDSHDRGSERRAGKEAAEAEAEEEEDEGEEEELDFAEQDAERAFGHEMRPFGVPNPNPYRPAKKRRGGS